MAQHLTTETLLLGYASGVFPMADPDDGRIYWYSPDPRCVFELDRFHVPRTLRQTVRQRRFEIRIDTSFREVMLGCADRPVGSWINAEIIAAYGRLHAAGFAHSVEAWQGRRLAGGLYGVALGGAFFGESMFHRVRDASKVALVGLVERLRARGFTLLDTQWPTPHLRRFGAVEIPRKEYLRRLAAALKLDRSFIERDE